MQKETPAGDSKVYHITPVTGVGRDEPSRDTME